MRFGTWPLRQNSQGLITSTYLLGVPRQYHRMIQPALKRHFQRSKDECILFGYNDDATVGIGQVLPRMNIRPLPDMSSIATGITPRPSGYMEDKALFNVYTKSRARVIALEQRMTKKEANTAGSGPSVRVLLPHKRGRLRNQTIHIYPGDLVVILTNYEGEAAFNKFVDAIEPFAGLGLRDFAMEYDPTGTERGSWWASSTAGWDSYRVGTAQSRSWYGATSWFAPFRRPWLSADLHIWMIDITIKRMSDRMPWNQALDGTFEPIHGRHEASPAVCAVDTYRGLHRPSSMAIMVGSSYK